jgi:hypothetical protein
MGNVDQRERKSKQPHRGGSDEGKKQHAPSRHGHEGAGEADPRRGSQRGEERAPESPSETDWPTPGRTPSEELTSDDDQD